MRPEWRSKHLFKSGQDHLQTCFLRLAKEWHPDTRIHAGRAAVGACALCRVQIGVGERRGGAINSTSQTRTTAIWFPWSQVQMSR